MALLDTVTCAARITRDRLPTTAAIIVDTAEPALHEVRDAQGEILWCASVSSPAHNLNDGLVDDVDDLFRQVIPYDGLAEAGGKQVERGRPYQDVRFPEETPAKRAAYVHVRYDELVAGVITTLPPARPPSPCPPARPPSP
ncbi:hypothetical protein BKI49_01090 [Streptomyces sp. Tue6028]|uniref:hypothetical protein n=1 Tax=Streptomyces sp. Tue6028 TaxID=2036037 RepID=UPI000BB32679|nr:hypothetical protein [Streptomyces sp. Tue6028]PBC65875.1 hypothetical protein BKI49_01090 [Streptomyces sp. Tue6028]